MATYQQLTQAGVTTRAAAELTGLPRSTATRRTTAPVVEPAAARPPANRLSAVERSEILAVLDAPGPVDAAASATYRHLVTVYVPPASSPDAQLQFLGVERVLASVARTE